MKGWRGGMQAGGGGGVENLLAPAVGEYLDEVAVFVCRDNHQPRGQQPILRFAPADAAIEARPQSTLWAQYFRNAT